MGTRKKKFFFQWSDHQARTFSKNNFFKARKKCLRGGGQGLIGRTTKKLLFVASLINDENYAIKRVKDINFSFTRAGATVLCIFLALNQTVPSCPVLNSSVIQAARAQIPIYISWYLYQIVNQKNMRNCKVNWLFKLLNVQGNVIFFSSLEALKNSQLNCGH